MERLIMKLRNIVTNEMSMSQRSMDENGVSNRNSIFNKLIWIEEIEAIKLLYDDFILLETSIAYFLFEYDSSVEKKRFLRILYTFFFYIDNNNIVEHRERSN